MSHNLTLTDGKHIECFLWQTPTFVTDKILLEPTRPLQIKAYVEWVVSLNRLDEESTAYDLDEWLELVNDHIILIKCFINTYSETYEVGST